MQAMTNRARNQAYGSLIWVPVAPTPFGASYVESTALSTSRRNRFLTSTGIHVLSVILLMSTNPFRSGHTQTATEDPYKSATMLYNRPNLKLALTPPFTSLRRGRVTRRQLASLRSAPNRTPTLGARGTPASISVPQDLDVVPEQATRGFAELPAKPTPPRLAVAVGFPAVQSAAVADSHSGLRVSVGLFSPTSASSDVLRSHGGTESPARVGDFPDAASSVSTMRKPPFLSPIEQTIEAVEITEVPKPQYTELARNSNIEGFVRVSVVFKANGKVVVTGIIHALGYGLDEAATSAVRGIRFKPACQGGRPIDQPAIVEAVFQLTHQALITGEIERRKDQP
jgi:TonB family protein